MNLKYLYAKFFKIVIRGKAIRNSHVDKKAKIYSGTEFYDSSIGKYSYVGYDCQIHKTQIGAFCSIANGVVIGGAKHPLSWVSTSPTFYNIKGGTGFHLGNQAPPELETTIIENDVWIGTRAIITQGVTIGNGAVIGCGAIVTKDIPPYAVVAGIPAKIIKYRFNEDMIKELVKSKWWELDDSLLSSISSTISSPSTWIKKLCTNEEKK